MSTGPRDKQENTSLIGTLLSYFKAEYHQLSLWYFISFIYGIATYYIASPSLNFVPIIVSISVFLILGLYIHRYYPDQNIILVGFCAILIASFIFGIACAKYHSYDPKTKLITKVINASIQGKIISSKPIKNGTQFVLSDVIIDNQKQEDLKIRVNINSAHNDAETSIGDTIEVAAKLYPLQSSIIPGGFDFGFYLYMDGVGGSGYSRSPLKILDDQKLHNLPGLQIQHLSSIIELSRRYIEIFREKIYQSLIENLGIKKGNFVAAILIGHTTAIDDKIADDMRDSGVSHILSVSGLHLSLVAMIFFSAARILLNVSNTISYRYDTKIISAIISITASFAYLLLTGSKIAATRAFIMTAIFIIANMIGRSAYPMRSVFIAAFLILMISPEFVMHPSFQLSFSAVICLISGYQFYLRNMHIFGSNSGLINNIKFYAIANIYSSIIASFATGPFVIFHFFKFANYSILMNLLAVPLMSFIIMPFGCLALILFGSGLEGYLFKFIGYFVGVIIDSAAQTVKLPGAIWHFGYISHQSLGVYALGFFFICVLQTPIRHIGFGIIIISFIMMALTPKAAFIYDTRYKALGALKSSDTLSIISDHQISSFNNTYWMHWYGASSLEHIQQNLYKEDGFFELGSDGFLKTFSKDINTTNPKEISHNNESKTLSINYNKCKAADIMLITSRKLNCNPQKDSTSLYIDYEKYSHIKTMVIFFDRNSRAYVEYTANTAIVDKSK